jgi:hypothetical protein
MNTSDLQGDAARVLHGNRCFTDGGLTIGTNKAKLTTGATVTVTVNGIFYTDSGGTTDIPFSSGHEDLPAGYSQLIVLAKTAASDGTYATYQGRAFKSETDVLGNTVYRGYDIDTVGQAATVRAIKGGDVETYTSAFLPTNVPATVTPVGIVKIVNATNTFDYGTTELDAAGVTATYYDISVTPQNASL